MLEKCTIPRQKIKKFLGRGHCPVPRPLPYWGGDTPSPNSSPSAPAAPRHSRLRILTRLLLTQFKELNLRIRTSRRRKPSNSGPLILQTAQPYQKSAQHFSCLATVHECHRQTPKSHKICQISQQSEKYNITNSYSCLLVLVDNLKTKTDKDDFSVWLPSINSVTESLLNW